MVENAIHVEFSPVSVVCRDVFIIEQTSRRKRLKIPFSPPMRYETSPILDYRVDHHVFHLDISTGVDFRLFLPSAFVSLSVKFFQYMRSGRLSHI